MSWLLLLKNFISRIRPEEFAKDDIINSVNVYYPIRKLSYGKSVERVQEILNIAGADIGVDGVFGPKTEEAVRSFQLRYNLIPKGVADLATFRTMNANYNAQFNLKSYHEVARPLNTLDYISNDAEKKRLFGSFTYRHVPVANNPERIIIDRAWVQDNITDVYIPQLVGVYGYHNKGHIKFHKKCVKQLKGLWQDIEDHGYLPYVKTYAGSWVPRLVRGSKTRLSNHAYGTAFDINATWNGLGREPAGFGKPGTVMDIVPLAEKWGFYWGGFWNRPDGMHFEVSKIIE